MARTIRTALALVAAAALVGSAVSTPDADAATGKGGSGAPTQSLKIVGGSLVEPGYWPSIAGLVKATFADGPDGLFCGGTVIDARTVLTAAHCMVKNGVVTTPDTFHVVVGRLRLSDSASGQRVAVESIAVHPNYNSDTMKNDFAVVRLAQPVNVPAATVATAADRLVFGSQAWMAGWGRTIEGGTKTDSLLTASAPVQSDATCAAADTMYDPAVMLCAGYPQGGVDTCQGDSGGPLMVNTERGWLLFGVTSFGQGCARAGIYGNYAWTSSASEWILGTAAALGQQTQSAGGGLQTLPCSPVQSVPCPTGGGTEQAAATPQTPVSPQTPVQTGPRNVKKPALTKVARGRALRCGLGKWQGDVAEFAVTWLRNGVAIRGANSLRYRLTVRDNGRSLACKITAENDEGIASARSRALRIR